METLLNWININATAVYVLLFGYCFIKSGAMPLFAGVLVAADALLLWPVVIAVFCGAYLGDELRFYIGRHYADSIQQKWPKTRKVFSTGKLLMENYGRWYIFLYRYPKGMRTIGALPLGFSKMPYQTFLFLNVTSIMIWGMVMVGSGLFLGKQAQDFGQNYYGLISIILFFGFATWIWFLFRKHKTDITNPQD